MYIKPLNLKKHSSIKIGQTIEVLMLEENDKIPKDRYLIAGANNILFSNNPPPLMMLSKDFASIKKEDNILIIGASMPTGRIVSYMRKHNIAGFVGGMLAMNAGVKSYEIFNILHSVKVDGEWIKKEDIFYGYRFASLGGIATHARFEIPLEKEIWLGVKCILIF